MEIQSVSLRSENKLIAAFMGVKPDGDWFNGQELFKAGLPFYYGLMGNGTNDLKFHCSWDWLMPVIQKIIKTIGYKSVEYCTTEEWYNYTNIARMYIGIDIQHAHYYVVEFIYWYNKNK